MLTERKIILVGVDDELSNKSIPIGDSKVDMDLLNGNVSANLNELIILEGYDIYILYTYQAHDFGISIHEADDNHSGKKNNHV